MAFSLSVLDDAIEDMRVAYSWYEEKRIGLGDEMIEEIENCYQEICENPGYFGFVNKNFRRIKIDRFPYRIIYEVENNKVIVISFDHNKQNRVY